MISGFSAHLNTLYGHVDEPDRCAAAAADGFRSVEIWAAPAGDAAARMVGTLRRLDLSLASVNTPQGPEPDDFGTVGDPDYALRWREDFLTTLAFARQAGSRAVNVLVGGRRGSAPRAAQRRCLLDNLDWALAQRAAGDPLLLLEPLNGADRRSPLLSTVSDAMSVIDELGTPPELRLLFDAYHLVQEEDDLIEAVVRAGELIGHVQLADYPGRAEPGTGHLPVARFLEALATTGYSGWVGLEYFPSSSRESPFAWLRGHTAVAGLSLPEVAS
jgi:hydroxypyruvate isomerase